MSFLLSKVLWAMAAPGNALMVVLAAGAALLFAGSRAARAGRWLVAVAAVGFTAIAVTPVSDWAARPIEDRFAPPVALPERVDGIVMLGGAVSPVLMADRGEPSVTDASERLLAFIELGLRYPDAAMLFAGGSGLLLRQDVKEDAVVRAVLAQAGFDDRRVVYESQSRNTWENAVYGRRLVGPADGQTWLLVTSALHMPRSMGIFRRIGWEVVPYPVDYRTLRSDAGGLRFDLAGGLDLFSDAVREWIGLAAYRLMDRTDALFPGPQPAK